MSELGDKERTENIISSSARPANKTTVQRDWLLESCRLYYCFRFRIPSTKIKSDISVPSQFGILQFEIELQQRAATYPHSSPQD